MAQHVFRAAGAPSFVPAEVGHHYVNISNGFHYLSGGTSLVSDWKLVTGAGSTDDLPEGVTNLYFTDERAQDAVAGALVDTASIDFTYNDGASQISAAVLPAGVDHNSLANFVANKHIDHSAVSVSAGAGLTGGGDLTTSRTISMPDVISAGSAGATDKSLAITVDAKGRVTALAAASIAILAAAVTDFAAAVRLVALTGISFAASTTITATDTVLSAFGKIQAQLTVLFGRTLTAGTGLTGGGDLSANRSFAITNTGVTAAAYGGANAIPVITLNAQGQATVASTIAPVCPISKGTVSATTSTTTTSTTDVLMNAMSPATLPAGDYLVLFGTTLESNNTGANVFISIWVGGAQVADTEKMCQPQFSAGGLGGSPSNDVPVETHAIVTLNGSQALEGRWRTSAGTATALRRKLSYVKMNTN